jgi:hypothetical protein
MVRPITSVHTKCIGKIAHVLIARVQYARTTFVFTIGHMDGARTATNDTRRVCKYCTFGQPLAILYRTHVVAHYWYFAVPPSTDE